MNIIEYAADFGVAVLTIGVVALVVTIVLVFVRRNG
jgi:hypothetical protein